ncbi:MAG: hypothetical protein FVQ79_02100 [Planctomycetes bacterium]|nr:hypothetical protein [Planctomycetota bacterium]
MNYKTKNNQLTLSLILVSIFIFTAFTSSAFAIGTALEAMETMEVMDTLQGAQSKSRPPKKTAKKNSPQENLQIENGEPDSARDTNEQYNTFISLINTSQPLPPNVASLLLQELKARQTSVGKFDTITLTQHYILIAWANYFNNDIKRAQQAARLAFKKNAWSKDTQLTQAAMAILAGNKPAPLPKEPTTKRASYDNESDKRETGPEIFSLDIDRIDTGLIGAKIKEMQLNCLNSTTLEYKYGTSNICILLWKLPKNSSAPSMTAGTMFTIDPNGFKRPVDHVSKTSGSSFADIGAFKKIFASAMGLSNIKFVAVNMDTAESKPDVLTAILQNAWPWAHVMVNDPTSNASQFKGVIVEENKPLLLVAGKDGTIKYAGPTTGFLAPMVVSQLSKHSQTRFSITNIFKSNPTGNGSDNAAGTTTVQNSINTTTQKPRFLSDKPPIKMSLEDEVAAQRDLEGAKLLINTGSKFSFPKKGIEACRKVLKDYPGTKYANEARMLLRKVPKRLHKRHKITNEELGL